MCVVLRSEIRRRMPTLSGYRISRFSFRSMPFLVKLCRWPTCLKGLVIRIAITCNKIGFCDARMLGLLSCLAYP